MKNVERRDVAFPMRRDDTGRFVDADPDEHLRDMIAQVLFTLPGERLNLPDFGAGVQRLVFAPVSADVLSTVRFVVQAQLQRWLGEVMRLEQVNVSGLDSRLYIAVSYVPVATQERREARFPL
jgi:phage baseplate assembly protein W